MLLQIGSFIIELIYYKIISIKKDDIFIIGKKDDIYNEVFCKMQNLNKG